MVAFQEFPQGVAENVAPHDRTEGAGVGVAVDLGATAAGIAYENDDEAWVNAGNLITELDPGDSLDTASDFDVPVGAVPESIELHDSFGSAGVVV